MNSFTARFFHVASVLGMYEDTTLLTNLSCLFADVEFAARSAAAMAPRGSKGNWLILAPASHHLTRGTLDGGDHDIIKAIIAYSYENG